MSLPNYLAKIKSSGIYRFVWDKSQVEPQQAETLRLVVGYSEKGPFNTPVYIDNVNDFTSIYGNISKRLERRGVYFHRLAQQALQAGPILALNLKPFGDDETVGYINFDPCNIAELSGVASSSEKVATVFDTTRFWALDPDKMVSNLALVDAKYITVAATDTKDNACSIFVRKAAAESYAGITLRSWYASQGLEIPEWIEPIIDADMSQYFAEVYVFRGKFEPTLYARSEKDGGISYDGPLSKYLVASGENCKIDAAYENAFGEQVDALSAMANDSNSNFVGVYSGILLPNFKDANGNYISLDLKFNMDNTKHKMLMKLDETVLEGADDLAALLTTADDAELTPVYIPGYTYQTITKDLSAAEIYSKCVGMLKEKGLRLALTNRVDCEYHYIVDTFDAKSINAKKELFQLAQEKDNAFAIVNFPKMSKFAGAGTNMKDAVSSFKLAMPSEVEGASYGAYYTQLTFSDGTVKSIVPSAALVSNLFMEKWGGRQPYYIVAGPNFGRISYSGLVGPDFNFGRADLDVLEPMGVNAIVYVPRLGTYINSNQTAKQVPVSGLSKIHIRELVIYLQNEIEHLLQSYQWELNTQSLRDTIRSKADAICETIKNNGGLFAFKNVCDETNNTAEVIDNEMIILDTEIEPARGAGKMVHQLTIHKTGALSSSVK